MTRVGTLLGRVGEWLRGGTRRLQAHEQAILAALRERLPPADRRVLEG